MSIRDFDALFTPKSVALIGASTKPGTVGGVLADNMMRAGFHGPVLPVNPKYGSVGGVLAWPDIASLPVVPDLGVIAVPPDAVPPVVKALRDKGARAAIVITAGFHDSGPGPDRDRLKALIEAAGPMRLMGPNTIGGMAPHIGLNASFSHIAPIEGDLAFIAQSGAVLTSVLDWATDKGIGFSHVAGLGDMLDVDFGDVLNFLAMDTKTRAILLYVEAVTNTRKFMSAARAAARTKPVIVIKSGRKAEGAKAASSHTGALAGADAVYDAAFKRAGMLRVDDMQELFDAVETLSRKTIRDLRGSGVGDRLGILTNGGGIGVLATDRLIELGGTLAELGPETLTGLDAVLPATWSRGNPVDIIGDAPGERYAAAMDVLLADRQIDAILALNCPTAIADSSEAAQAITAKLKKARKPVFTSWLGDGSARPARHHFRDAGVPTYDTAEGAVRAYMHSVRYGRNQQMLMQTPPAIAPEPEDARDRVRKTLAKALDEDRPWLTEVEAKSVLEAYSIPIARTFSAATAAEAEEAARQFSFGDRVAVKILSKDITHKSDVGGVVLNLETPEQTRAAAESMLQRMRQDFPDANIEGVSVQEMILRPGSYELIVGLNEDPQFGPVVLFGQGGKAVEVIGDTAMGLPPLNPILASEMIRETRVSHLLRGFRDEMPVDMEALQHVLITVGRIAIDHPQIVELDINPLIADAKGVVALDARIRVQATAAAGEDRLAIRPYPQHLEGTVALRDGAEIPVRPIKPEDGPALQQMFSATNQDDLRLRFFHAMKKIPTQLAARLTQIDYSREMAFVALNPADRSELVGVVHLSADADNTEAEYSVLVRSDWKGAGLGYALMQAVIDYGANRGIQRLYGEVLSDNHPMIAMCQDLGFAIRRDPEDPLIQYVSLDLTKAAA